MTTPDLDDGLDEPAPVRQGRATADPKDHVCPNCLRVFTTANALGVHVYNKHPEARGV